MARAVQVDEFEQVVGQFFASLPQAGQAVEIALDGKTLRGTIPFGQTRGVHLLAAYLPCEGGVLMQVAVDGHENEIRVAPQVLKRLDLQGKIVTGDALLTQRKLAQQIGDAGGDYVFPVKENQPQLRHDIQTLFVPEACIKGFSPAPKERRTLTVSRDLKGYVDWPYAEQVFQVEREFIQLNTGEVTREVTYGVSSLTAQEADAGGCFCQSKSRPFDGRKLGHSVLNRSMVMIEK